MMRIEKNIGPADQLIRTIVAIGAIGLVLAGIVSGTLVLLLVIVGVVLAVTAALWFCPLYRMLGVSTCRTVQPR
jgi:hypothetical protein